MNEEEFEMITSQCDLHAFGGGNWWMELYFKYTYLQSSSRPAVTFLLGGGGLFKKPI
jgi:hypothetical protein